MANVVRRGLSGAPRDPEKITNYWMFTYRDLLDDKFRRRPVTVDYSDLRDSAGGILNTFGPLDLGVMTGSLAQRVARCTARLGSEQPFDRRVEVAGQFEALHVAKNDNVTVTHRLLGNVGGEARLARVVRETFEPKGGVRNFTVRYTTPDYYRDSDHGPPED
jgi:hypothetical protein